MLSKLLPALARALNAHRLLLHIIRHCSLMLPSRIRLLNALQIDPTTLRHCGLMYLIMFAITFRFVISNRNGRGFPKGHEKSGVLLVRRTWPQAIAVAILDVLHLWHQGKLFFWWLDRKVLLVASLLRVTHEVPPIMALILCKACELHVSCCAKHASS